MGLRDYGVGSKKILPVPVLAEPIASDEGEKTNPANVKSEARESTQTAPKTEGQQVASDSHGGQKPLSGVAVKGNPQIREPLRTPAQKCPVCEARRKKENARKKRFRAKNKK